MAPAINLDERLALGPREAAAALGVSPSWLRRAMREHGLPYSRVAGRILIRRDELLRWLEAHRERSARAAAEIRLVDDLLARVQRR